MTTYEIVPATEAHAIEIAENMRQADVEEIWASSRSLPMASTTRSFRVSRDPKIIECVWHDTKTGTADSKAMCIFGVTTPTALSRIGCPWMLGHKDLPLHAKPFLKLSREYVRQIKQDYDILINWVDARNTLSLRWMKWVGLQVFPPEPFGPDQLPFHKIGFGLNV